MNAIPAIHPYRHEGLWVLDDEAVGLRQEAFVSGEDVFLVWTRDPADSSVAREGTGSRGGVSDFSRREGATD